MSRRQRQVIKQQIKVIAIKGRGGGGNNGSAFNESKRFNWNS